MSARLASRWAVASPNALAMPVVDAAWPAARKHGAFCLAHGRPGRMRISFRRPAPKEKRTASRVEARFTIPDDSGTGTSQGSTIALDIGRRPRPRSATAIHSPQPLRCGRFMIFVRVVRSTYLSVAIGRARELKPTQLGWARTGSLWKRPVAGSPSICSQPSLPSL